MEAIPVIVVFLALIGLIFLIRMLNGDDKAMDEVPLERTMYDGRHWR